MEKKTTLRPTVTVAVVGSGIAGISCAFQLLKSGIDVGAGVIDEDYRGNVGVILFNHGEADFAVRAGDRIAQLVLERIAVADVLVVEALDDTARGAGGFGSTGVSSAAAASAAAAPPAAAGAGAAAADGASAEKKPRTAE